VVILRFELNANPLPARADPHELAALYPGADGQPKPLEDVLVPAPTNLCHIELCDSDLEGRLEPTEVDRRSRKAGNGIGNTRLPPVPDRFR
jgi:hypothetical protein